MHKNQREIYSAVAQEHLIWKASFRHMFGIEDELFFHCTGNQHILWLRQINHVFIIGKTLHRGSFNNNSESKNTDLQKYYHNNIISQ